LYHFVSSKDIIEISPVINFSWYKARY